MNAVRAPIRATTTTAAMLALCACGSLGDLRPTGAGAAANAAPASGPATGDGVVLGALAESGIPRGECGMVLWTLDANRPAAVFRYVSGKTGEIVIAGESVDLVLERAGGASAFGVFEEQTYTGAGGLRVAVDVRFSLGFDGGAYLERGLIALESADGWRTVTPSAGLAGCRG